MSTLLFSKDWVQTKTKDDNKKKDKQQVQFIKGHLHRGDYLQHRAK